MIVQQAKAVTSNQNGVHDGLEALVRRHQQHTFLKPIAKHNQAAFDQAQQRLQAWQSQRQLTGNPQVILDSCCGVGESSYHLAKANPDCFVVGVDKSAERLSRQIDIKQEQVPNYILVRADLNDFWRLVLDAGWALQEHFLLYPNPWPKQKHVARRWHASAIFPTLLKLSPKLTVRSNWELYIKEFQLALSLYDIEADYFELAADTKPMTPFERKYQEAGQVLYELVAHTQ